MAEEFMLLTCDQLQSNAEASDMLVPTQTKNLVIPIHDLAGHLFYTVVQMLAGLTKEKDRENVIYKPELQKKVIYPTMINITHIYAYYGAHNALKQCMDDDVQFMLTTDNESALSLVVKNCDTENRVLNDIVDHITKREGFDKEHH